MVNEMRVFMKAEKSRGQSSVTVITASCAPPPKSSPDRPPHRLWGVLTRKERWGLSWQGWVALFLVLLLAVGFLLLTVQPFLAVTHRVDAKVLVVEGWVHEYAIRAGAQEFMAGYYQRLFTTGGPVTGSGGYTWDADTTASVGAGNLLNAGVRPESLQMVPSHLIGRDRTYYSAVALRDWFRERKMDVGSINVVTESTHARRTWLLFQEAFGKRVNVGIIAVHNPDYDAKHWWRSSDGFREVVSEAMAYVYAKLFFHPPKQLDPS
jgi:uncharacterized SAM-binding protein YcdF (DUF218 family)